MVFESDGGIFIDGIFSDIDDLAPGPSNGQRWGVAKLTSDGNLDTSFTTSHEEGQKIEPTSFLRESDGSTFIAFNRLGVSTAYPAIPHGFGRLLSNGSLDSGFDPIASFNPSPLGPNFISQGFTPLSDGSLLLFGQGGNAVSYGHLVLNNGQWSEDTSYQANTSVPFATAFPRSDGKVVLNGYSFN